MDNNFITLNSKASLIKTVSDLPSGIDKTYLSKVIKLSKGDSALIERFWKCLTLFILEKKLGMEFTLFTDNLELLNSFTNLDVSLKVDQKLRAINKSQEDTFVTLIFNGLDNLTKNILLVKLIDFWQYNPYEGIRCKIHLSTNIFKNLIIENKTHLQTIWFYRKALLIKSLL